MKRIAIGLILIFSLLIPTVSPVNAADQCLAEFLDSAWLNGEPQEVKNKLNYNFTNLESSDTLNNILIILNNLNIKYDTTNITLLSILNILSKELINKYCIEPTFIYNYPKIMCPFAKENLEISEYFELIINKKKYLYTSIEINNPKILYDVFSKHNILPKNYDIIKILEYGMPETSNINLNIENFVNLFC